MKIFIRNLFVILYLYILISLKKISLYFESEKNTQIVYILYEYENILFLQKTREFLQNRKAFSLKQTLGDYLFLQIIFHINKYEIYQLS